VARRRFETSCSAPPILSARYAPAFELGQPLFRSRPGSLRERFLGGLLGEVEVAEEADQCRDDAAPLLAEDVLEAQ
jgi:hypothetical protein